MLFKGIWMVAILAAATTYVDMYQDRNDPNKTVIVVERDGYVQTYSVKNSDLKDVKKIERMVFDGYESSTSVHQQ